MQDASIEKPRLTLGFLPLTDSAPLVVAQELGLFAREGLDVTLSREASWANIRDKVALGVLDGAQMLAGLPLAASLGVGGITCPMVTGLSLGHNGSAVTVSRPLRDRMAKAAGGATLDDPAGCGRALRVALESDRAAGRAPPVLAMVYPVSTHHDLLRYWLAASGIDADRDLKLIVIPPPQMVANLSAGTIDGFCVGEPWNARAVEAGIGVTLFASRQIWSHHPDKVFGVTRAFARACPATHQALLRALIAAAHWLDEAANRPAAATMLSGRAYVQVPAEILRLSLTGQMAVEAGQPVRPLPDQHVFHAAAAGFPWLSHAAWFLDRMRRRGLWPAPMEAAATAAAIYRPDLYAQAAAALDLPCPTIVSKIEGAHDQPWTLTEATRPIAMAADAFFDGCRFDPAAPLS